MNSYFSPDHPTLREIIESAKMRSGGSLQEFTVLASQRDPYRLDTPANHRVAEWLLSALEEVGHDFSKRIHLRGLHYKLVGRVLLPDFSEYTNTDATWTFLSDKAAKAARFLGYLPWESIKDARNSEPLVFGSQYDPPRWLLSAGEIQLRMPETLEPTLFIGGDLYRQPFRQVVIAEKQGVIDCLLPVCKRYEATLATPAGEVSDQMLFDLLYAADRDGRPLVIHQLGDFDPAGWQMAVSTSRTVQALVDSRFPDLEVIVNAAGLNREHCEEWGLPSSPLKDSEKRADRWSSAMGWEQTELDAAVALQPELFAGMVDSALSEYHDHAVENEASWLRAELEQGANETLADELGDRSEQLRQAVQDKLGSIESLVAEVNSVLRIDPSELDLEGLSELKPLIGEAEGVADPLLDTNREWSINTQRLKARKDY